MLVSLWNPLSHHSRYLSVSMPPTTRQEMTVGKRLNDYRRICVADPESEVLGDTAPEDPDAKFPLMTGWPSRVCCAVLVL